MVNWTTLYIGAPSLSLLKINKKQRYTVSLAIPIWYETLLYRLDGASAQKVVFAVCGPWIFFNIQGVWLRKMRNPVSLGMDKIGQF